MRVNALDHVNIRTADIASSARFYAEVFDLEIRNGPPPMTPEQVRWLYDRGGRPVIHLVQHSDAKGAPGSTGPIDHVAFNCTGKNELIDRLKQRGAKYDVHEMTAIGRTLIFTRDPHGIMLELNFDRD